RPTSSSRPPTTASSGPTSATSAPPSATSRPEPGPSGGDRLSRGARRRRRCDPFRDLLDDIPGVPACARDEHRRERVLERDAQEVEPGHGWADAAHLVWPAVVTGDRRRDKRVVGPVAGGP